MSYITRADIEAIYGAEFLALLIPVDADIDAAVQAAAVMASGEADLYLSKRLPVPLAAVPAGLIGALADLTCYRLAATHDRLTDEISKRAEQARKLLADIAKGIAGLGTAEPAALTQPGSTGEAAGGSYFESRPRNFGRERGLP